MLVGSCMEHIVGLESGKEALHASVLRDACDDDICRNIREVSLHHQADVMLRSLGIVNEHHLTWPEGSNLPDHL